jgi:hypothetical protein
MAQVVSCWPVTTEAQVNPRSVHVGFVVDRVTLGQVFHQVLWFSLVSIIDPILCSHSSDTDAI